MKILIITSCTSKKKFSLSYCLKQEDFSKGLSHIKQRENELKEYFVPAEELYTGQQHKKIMQAVNYLRKNNPNINLKKQ